MKNPLTVMMEFDSDLGRQEGDSVLFWRCSYKVSRARAADHLIIPTSDRIDTSENRKLQAGLAKFNIHAISTCRSPLSLPDPSLIALWANAHGFGRQITENKKFRTDRSLRHAWREELAAVIESGIAGALSYLLDPQDLQSCFDQPYSS
jgi:hypothetical protein